MTTPINLINEYYAVEVPDKIDNPNFYRVNNESIMFAWDDIERPLNPHDVVKVDTYIGDLSNYIWPKFLFTSNGCSEEDARKVVENYGGSYIDFEANERDYKSNEMMWYKKAIDSFESLLRSKGLNPNKHNYAILKKEA